MDNNINNNNNNFFTMNTIDKFEFTFNFKDEDSIYISHHTNQLDEEMFSDVYHFVENHCQLEEGDSIAMLVADLLNQIYN